MPEPRFDSTTLVCVALGYVAALFAVAYVGDRLIRLRHNTAGRPLIYALSLSVYCTSWTLYGSVGLAAKTGYDFIPVYLGPILMFTLGYPLLVRIVRLAKTQNLTSVSDFLAARYGKSQKVAFVAALSLIIAILPYIALQLKAISISVDTLIGGGRLVLEPPGLPVVDTAILITFALAVFAILFGTRNIDATEHQDGLILAIAVESVVKLAAITAVGLFVVFAIFNDPFELWRKASADPKIHPVFTGSLHGGRWMTLTLLSACCIVMLPRQFHVVAVESNSENEMKRARWLFPLYLIAINIFIVPIALAGLLLFPPGTVDPDFFVLTIPAYAGNDWIALTAFIGGLSAATAMVIVEAVALAIMASSGIVLPLLLRMRTPNGIYGAGGDVSQLVLFVRRGAIILVLLLAYFVYRTLAQFESLVTIGLISFTAVTQLAPAFFGGLFWRNATANGAIAGIISGMAVWFYTLVVPWMTKGGFLPASIVESGPFGLAALRPEALFYFEFEPLEHAVFWTLTANVAAFIAVSLLRAPEPIERLQAQIFAPGDQDRSQPKVAWRWRTSLTIGELESTAARYLGTERARRSFSAFAARRPNLPGLPAVPNPEADIHAIRFTEHLLTSAVGAASARLIMSLLLNRADVSQGSALQLLDDASEALQFNRDLLQSAVDQVRHGLAVFDKDMRLICWNRQFRELLNLPEEVVQLGVSLDAILRISAGRAGLESPNLDAVIGDRVLKLAVRHEIYHERELSGENILEVRTNPMPQGGIVVTFSDITHRMLSDAALARANETLERRVQERTRELLVANEALEEAKAEAEAANADKTRFIAAASHDILQPLNAARLYAASLSERDLRGSEGHLIRNLDSSLQAVEEIFSALIDISRMDAGRLEADDESFPLSAVLEQLIVEFQPAASAKGLQLIKVPTSVWVRTDRRLIRRVLQNLLANAIKYTVRGRVLIGVRKRSNNVAIAVYDTGPGIAPEHQNAIFKEFHRLDETAHTERGVGLGLSIVERIAKILDARLTLRSQIGHGSMFSVELPRAPVQQPGVAKSSGAPALGSFEGVRVLCIDNEPAVLEGMEALLKGWKSSVETAGSAEAVVLRRMGFPMTASVWPSVILADYHLDAGTGVEAIARIYKASGQTIPAIIITADHSVDVQRDIRARGHMLLRKPVKPAVLRAALAQALIQRSRPAAPDANEAPQDAPAAV